MNQKLWTALLLPFAFSLAVLPAEAESIPIHRKSVISVKAPAARKAVPRKKAQRLRRKGMKTNHPAWVLMWK